MTGQLSREIRPVVVGAGPAGIRAAEALVAAGLRPVVLDEGDRAGGQIYRQPPAAFSRGRKALYGFEAHKAERLHRTFEELRPAIDYRPRTLVWNAVPGELHVMGDAGPAEVPFSHLVLATGATDRIYPFKGWTLPGVFSMGGAQIALKAQGCTIGESVALVGTGPLLYLVAYQYAKAGARIAVILDSARFTDQLAGAPAMLYRPATLAKGLYYVAWLRARGIRIVHGVVPTAAEGAERVEGLVWRTAAGDARVACDAVALGYGLRSETQISDLLGCRFSYSEAEHESLPERDAAGRTSVAGVYIAGDGAGVLGADAAEAAGPRAALALCEDAGLPVDGAATGALEARVSRWRRFRAGIRRAFPVPRVAQFALADDVLLCRCEEITVGALRAACGENGVDELNRLKALTRIGMGRCQGRMCGPAARALLAHHSGRSPGEVGRLRGQAPIKPMPLELMPLVFGEPKP
ncbi:MULTISPECIES: FAD/NAD(P)-binding oxidoreductase [unclassified Chelatococcus]|uniref:NAD(P)/FAD-dependent oxidoreductase n=1 Tax=unclassified Chelatococcus TaxID=2638111 RepID=UPI001BCC6AFB|nr:MULTISPECIES: FAD/NAD(P)-binding oxidoreductase [unclassified Chelatococcus]MBS7696171.1 FAD-dependent oxidoreductase [Chelatococcus sp. YT9]MBX3557802.1 FAD-dependent oxidoreductase [Chelatococcus sp.]